jgi:hypothetical protein
MSWDPRQSAMVTLIFFCAGWQLDLLLESLQKLPAQAGAAWMWHSTLLYRYTAAR